MNKSYFQRGPNVKNPLNSINVIKNLPARINQSFQIKINKPSILKRTGQFLYHFMDPRGPLLYFILLEVFSFWCLRSHVGPCEDPYGFCQARTTAVLKLTVCQTATNRATIWPVIFAPVVLLGFC